MPTYDVIVVGAGAMGSAAAYRLARRGSRVLALDANVPPHRLGSTHGGTRIIREAYYEHPLYVPLVRRAYQAWAELEEESGRTLYVRTGGMMVGPEGGALVAGARASALEHGIPHELLGADEVRRAYPHFRVPEGMAALLEHRAGILFPEACVEAHLALARAHGAEVRCGEAATGWTADGAGVAVTTAAGTYRAQRLVLAAGPWMPELLAGLELPLQVERQTFHWYRPAEEPEAYGPGRCPIALWEYGPGRFLATFPDFGDGVKAQVHHEGALTTPAGVARETTPADEAPVLELLRRFLPGAAGPLLATSVCLYTNTPDAHFVLDRHPASPRVVVASPCSGHGFKFSSAIGEAIAALALDEPYPLDLSPFAVGRFAASATRRAG
ncbi:MAG TPA: N-methyl-L-tryptophan oxidase [Longimicrobiaceae bacterium]|nr:N-methyl-L-tryptophan oxidase [Longimicrobiaceae bacterium]